MELRNLKTFRVVAEHLNFTRAAKVLHLAQSSVSAQIKILEAELETRLFDRIGRQVTLTDTGRLLYNYARRIEDMDLEIRSEIQGMGAFKGRLTIRVPETLAALYMPGVVKTFHSRHPEVRLNFINCSDLQLREELNSGRIDLAFLMSDDLNLTDVNLLRLAEESLVLTCGPDHELAGMPAVSWNELANHTLLLPKTD